MWQRSRWTGLLWNCRQKMRDKHKPTVGTNKKQADEIWDKRSVQNQRSQRYWLSNHKRWRVNCGLLCLHGETQCCPIGRTFILGNAAAIKQDLWPVVYAGGSERHALFKPCSLSLLKRITEDFHTSSPRRREGNKQMVSWVVWGRSFLWLY